MSVLLAKMYSIAAEAHKEQFDKAGRPYILHCIAVAHLLGDSVDDELMCIALGHDLFEDTAVTRTQLQKEGFSERVISGIHCMTKQRGQSYEEYKAQVKCNADAVKVKMADLTHNSDIRRMKEVNQKDFDRTVRYRKFYNELANECDMD